MTNTHKLNTNMWRLLSKLFEDDFDGEMGYQWTFTDEYKTANDISKAVAGMIKHKGVNCDR